MYFIRNGSNLTALFDDGSVYTITVSDNLFDMINQLRTEHKYEELKTIFNLNKHIIEGSFRITQENNKMVINISANTEINIPEQEIENNNILKFIKILQDNGITDSSISDVRPFLEKVYANAFIDPVDLYNYLKHGDFKITKDGNILAYKNVGMDLKSIYDNKTQHAIGQYTEVKVYDTNRDNLCSKGLHFATKEYLNSYKGDVTIVVEIDPRDIVSIPNDYSFMKGRCRKYKTIKIIDKDKTLDDVNFDKSTNGEVKEVTVSVNSNNSSEKSFKNRVEETKYYMDKYNDPQRVADIMGISIETVKRNMRRYKQYESNI